VTTRRGTGARPADSLRPALDVLRARTREPHRELDATLSGPDGRVVDTSGYVRLLTTLSSLHAHTDESLQAWAGATPWVREALDPRLLPRRSTLYASDLTALGRPDLVVTPHREACDDARGLGHLYVVAGSSKGARVVLHGLRDDLAPDARRGLEDAAHAGARLWRECHALLTTPLPDELVRRAADEAERLFTRLLRDLRGSLGPGQEGAA
jgi:heme oxygenase